MPESCALNTLQIAYKTPICVRQNLSYKHTICPMSSPVYSRKLKIWVLFTFVSNLARCRSGSRLRSRYRSRYASDLTHLVRYLVLDLALDLVLDQELDVQRTEKRFLLFDITISMHFFVDLCKFNRCNGLPTSSKPRTK